MIKKVYSTLPTFATINLHAGLNILLADVTEQSTEKNTRNGLGKTTFIEVINFLLGSSCNKNSLFKSPPFISHFFIMDIELENNEVTIKRCGESANDIFVECLKETKLGKLLGNRDRLPLKEWNEYLGETLFNLHHDESLEYLSFRKLFPYFTRNAKDGGFLDSTRYLKTQKVLDVQILLTYLLGLNTNLAVKQKELESKKQEIKDLKKIVTSNTYKDMMIENVNLDSEIPILEERADRLKKDLEQFLVHPEYREIEKQATEITQKINKLGDENFIAHQIILDLKESTTENEVYSMIDIKSLYDEVSVKLPEAVVKSYEKSKAFHDGLLQNRKKYLQGELDRYEAEIQQRTNQIELYSKEQSKFMEILNSHGALDQLVKLQTHLNKLNNKIETYKRQQEMQSKIKLEQASLKISEQKLIIKVANSLKEYEKVRNKAILFVEEVSEALYDTVAQLKIGQSESSKGGRYDIHMLSRSQKSMGINSMLIYCFDMMLIQMSAYLNRNLGLLIHDSALFDSVDERQVASALLFGKKQAEHTGFQYIVTLNSDQLPSSVYDKLQENIIDRILTDDDESGCLMGVYY